MNNINILLNINFKDILYSILNKSNYLFKAGFKLEEVEFNKVEYISVKCETIFIDDVCKLGGMIYYYMYSNNKLKISNNNSNSFKSIMSKYLNSEKNYSDYFVLDVYEINKGNNSMPNSFNFFVNVNYDNSNFEVIDNFNKNFNTDFELIDIKDNDGLDYAKIKFINSSVIDIFCLGYLITKDDVQKNEAKRKK